MKIVKMFGYNYSREAVRVKVKKCEGKQPPEMRRFSVDPQITSLEVLQSILTKAFDIKSDFSVSYRLVEDGGLEVYVPVLSDWDLDTAFLKAHNASLSQKCEPCINLKIDMKPFAEALDEWESEPQTISTNEQKETPNLNVSIVTNAPANTEQRQAGLPGIIMNQVEKTFSMVTRALNLSDDLSLPPRQPLCDAEFRAFLDPVGQVVHMTKLRDVIYYGGIEPSLRKVVWKHILNVYPDGMNGKERMDYMKRKSTEYYELRSVWKECIQKGQVNGDLAYVTSMVKKDVLRTDRHHKFYAGNDDNQNIASLFNILTTYALNHPLVSYCQGMSDLASPLIVTMGDEAHAYICLCALMMRLYPNFLLDGEAMTLKFTHLGDSLQIYDPQFYAYLKHQQADDLLFCYRWLLLEMKREFAFDDSLRMLEVLWSSLPPNPPQEELRLKETAFVPCEVDEDGEPPISPLVKTPRETAYTKVCAIRRQSSSLSLNSTPNGKLSSCKRMNHSLDENTSRTGTVNNSLRHAKEFQSMDDAVLDITKLQSNSKKVHSKSPSPNQGISLSPLASQIHKTHFKYHKRSVNNNQHETSLSVSTDNLAKNQTSADYMQNFSKSTSGVYEFFSSLEKLDKTKVENVHRVQSVNENGWQKKQPSITLTRSSGEITHRSSDLSKIEKSKDSDSSPDDSQEYYPMTTSMTRELRLELEHLDRQVFGQQYNKNIILECADSVSDSVSLDEKVGNTTECDCLLTKVDSEGTTANDIQVEMAEMSSCLKVKSKSSAVRRSPDNVFVWENPLHTDLKPLPQTPDEQADLEYDGDTAEIVDETTGIKSLSPIKHVKKTGSKMENAKPGIGFFSNMTQELENARKNCENLLANKQNQNIQSIASTISSFQKKYEMVKVQHSPLNRQTSFKRVSSLQTDYSEDSSGAINSKLTPTLPPPSSFGGGNPFLMFLCLTLLLQHRDYIMRNHMDYNELAMHFDKMVRKHNVNRVLNQARQLYAAYLKMCSHSSDVNT